MSNSFYVREGLGRYGKPIRVYKFRTMELDAEKKERRLREERGVDGLGKIVDDPRITKRGRYLRRYWIDEIPQIVNVLKGEMSIVGIRPRSERTWLLFPESHKEHAQRYKPGLASVDYYETEVEGIEELLEIETGYLEEKDVSPLKTDLKYLIRILYNIIFKGLRSR